MAITIVVMGARDGMVYAARASDDIWSMASACSPGLLFIYVVLSHTTESSTLMWALLLDCEAERRLGAVLRVRSDIP
jgi:hypothetical protein